MKRLIKTFHFAEDCRNEFDLTGGLRISEHNRLEVPRTDVANGPSPSTPVYDTAQTYTARTPTFNPGAATSWELFSVRHPTPPSDPDPGITSPPYVIRFRVSDGSSDFYWDGAAWSAVTLNTHWNTEAEVSTNISSFPIRSIAFVVNMWTTSSSVTPALESIKLLYQSKLSEQYDVIYESLIPDLKESLRGRARVAYRMQTTGTTINFSDLEALGFESSYDVTDVLEVYNYSTDSTRTTNLLASYNTSTSVITTSSSIAAGEVAWVEFEYVPTIAVHTSKDYSELSSIPGVDIIDINTTTVVEQVNTSDGVVDPTTDTGWLVPGPAIRTISFSIELVCDKQYDLEHLASSLREWSQSTDIRMRGADEVYTILKLGDFNYSSERSLGNLRTAKVDFSILNVAFFERPATAVTGLQSINFSGGNLTLTI